MEIFSAHDSCFHDSCFRGDAPGCSDVRPFGHRTLFFSVRDGPLARPEGTMRGMCFLLGLLLAFYLLTPFLELAVR